MLQIGIIGLGFMGRMHFGCWKKTENVQLVAICDIDEAKFTGGGGGGNIDGADEPLDLTGINTYNDIDKMLAEAKLDAVSITLPTYMHASITAKALEAGLHVLCEKPMAMDTTECQTMTDAAEKTGKMLQIGHCIRFWPEYVKAKEIIDSGEYGKVKSATFQRMSLTPVWSWDNWILDGPKSGGATLDLHIHDTDFVQYVFGMPKAVFTRAARGPSNDYDHIVTNYIYDDVPVVTAEGGWMMAPEFGFEMSFNIILEKATIVFDCTRDPAFRVCTADGKSFIPELLEGDGYHREIAHFAKVVAGEKVPKILTPRQSLDSVAIIGAEKESARTIEKVIL